VGVTDPEAFRRAEGEADRDKARKRELVAAVMARHVAARLGADPQLTALVGGDFNVGEIDAAKNGMDLADDRTDGYDDTHALLAGREGAGRASRGSDNSGMRTARRRREIRGPCPF
jgi:hypothetical protein